ncbi:MAG: hypothetical protein GF341_03410 [candidate division Zixibacteria bacterium]|nr:hypothetical protein [candidate division Zixibacteria bacterium]
MAPNCRRAWIALASLVVMCLSLTVAQAGDEFPPGPQQYPDGNRLVVWMSDGEGMQPSVDLERFLIDRIGATGDRVVLDPGIAHSVLRVLGLQRRSVYDPAAVHQVAVASGSRWVLWVKTVARDTKSKKLLGVPYLFNHRRLDMHVFYDVRLYDAHLGILLGSKRLKLRDKGEATWQVTDDERMDPMYNNDPVEIHESFRMLEWKAAALISGYCADLLHPRHMAAVEEQIDEQATADAMHGHRTISPAAERDRTRD